MHEIVYILPEKYHRQKVILVSKWALRGRHEGIQKLLIIFSKP